MCLVERIFRPDPNVHYTHLDSLFSEPIEWSLIETHLPDMIRVALSIKAGKITPSTILRKLGAYSRKNKLYQAFQELGRVIRTHFLLHYLDDAELRSTIQAATNKSEAFNGFAKWAFFGGEGVITHNRRAEQRKCIKFNHLIANCLIFYNVQVISDVLHQLNQEGIEFDEQVVAALVFNFIQKKHLLLERFLWLSQEGILAIPQQHLSLSRLCLHIAQQCEAFL